MQYKAPVDSTLFLLRDVLKFDNELTEPILTEIAKLSEETIAPTNAIGDIEGCKYVKEENKVKTPEAFKEPYKAFAEGGWIGLSVPERFGGQGLPFTLAVAANEFVSSSNMAWSLFPGITRGAIQALIVSGSDAQKETFIPPMVRGEWTGTMCLTEPHCGTDLGLLKTKAVDKQNGSYEITGQKIYISGGEHDLTKNILHLVLARVEGDPEGVKGISLFAVPKVLPDFSRNKVFAGSIEEKMGIHGSPTCVMNFDGATGFLVGERCRGLQGMFIMMNELRLGCAIHGLSQSELAFQNALQYAKDRIQSKSAVDLSGPSVAILSHPDIRRMLMDVRCINEAARLLVLEAATLVDKIEETKRIAKYNEKEYNYLKTSLDASPPKLDTSSWVGPDIERAIEEAEDRLGLMTPVLKGVITDYGVENAIKMQQVWGGHGYVRDNGMEQIVRDARIAMIYEGANGIQALDLVGRKLPKNMGRAVMRFFKDTETFLTSSYEHDINHIVQPMALAIDELKQATEWLAANGMKNPNDAGAASYPYMKMFGLVLLGLAHIRICLATDDKARHTTATYFMENVLPESSFLLKKIRQGSSTMMALTPDEF
jgi:alkylation response protein AidB-like acyl-CoA dehydrogenase